MLCSSNGASPQQHLVASNVQKQIEPTASPISSDEEDYTPKPLDSCDAGQLEACAIDRCPTLASKTHMLLWLLKLSYTC